MQQIQRTTFLTFLKLLPRNATNAGHSLPHISIVITKETKKKNKQQKNTEHNRPHISKQINKENATDMEHNFPHISNIITKKIQHTHSTSVLTHLK